MLVVWHHLLHLKKSTIEHYWWETYSLLGFVDNSVDFLTVVGRDRRTSSSQSTFFVGVLQRQFILMFYLYLMVILQRFSRRIENTLLDLSFFPENFGNWNFGGLDFLLGEESTSFGSSFFSSFLELLNRPVIVWIILRRRSRSFDFFTLTPCWKKKIIIEMTSRTFDVKMRLVLHCSLSMEKTSKQQNRRPVWLEIRQVKGQPTGN